MNLSTPEQLDELELLVAEMCPAPWSVGDWTGEPDGRPKLFCDEWQVTVGGSILGLDRGDANGIVALRNAAPSLLAIARRALQLQSEIDAFAGNHRAPWRSYAEIERELAEARKEIGLLSAAIATPEVYAGIISEVVERERDQLAAENARLREQLAAREGEKP